MSINLYIIRHAWAEARGPQWDADDSRRPLTEEGRRRWLQVACQLTETGVRPSIVATSPYVRCRQTAEIFVKAVGHGCKLVDLEALEPGGRLDAAIEWTATQARQGATEIAWVGHSPDVEFQLAALIGGDAALRFAKGASALVRFDFEIARGLGELQWLVTAKILGF